MKYSRLSCQRCLSSYLRVSAVRSERWGERWDWDTVGHPRLQMPSEWQITASRLQSLCPYLDGMWCCCCCCCCLGAYQVPPSAGDVITFICDTQISNLLCQLPRLPRRLLSHNYCLVTHSQSPSSPSYPPMEAGTCHAHRYTNRWQSAWEQEQEQKRGRKL